MLQKLNENVAVIAVFDEAGVRPLRIKRGERVYHIREVVHIWQQKSGLDSFTHFAVKTNEAISIELAIDMIDLTWRIARIETED